MAVGYFDSRGMTYQIIVAADGADGTREIVREMAATNPALLATGAEARRGKGLGIREAVAIATGTIIGYADADNKVPIEDFDKFRPVLAAGAGGPTACERVEAAAPIDESAVTSMVIRATFAPRLLFVWRRSIFERQTSFNRPMVWFIRSLDCLATCRLAS